MKKPSTKGRHPSFIASAVRAYRYFFLNLVPAPKTGLTIACGGWERCAPNYRVNRANFPFYGIEYVAKGRGLLTVNGRAQKLLPGAVFAYEPHTSHIIETIPNEPLEKYFIDFSGLDSPRIIGRKVFGARGISYLHHFHPIHVLYEQMMESGLKGGRLAPRHCVLLLELLSLLIEESAYTPTGVQGRARQSFNRCRAELEEHYRTIRSVTELAERTHLDPAYLTRLFDRFVGESPHQMLTRLKVNEAAAHLLGGKHTVKEVASRVGFSDPYHFSRVFKKHHGIPPARFQGVRASIQRAE